MFLKNLFLLFKTWEILCKIQIPSFSKKKKREILACLPLPRSLPLPKRATGRKKKACLPQSLPRPAVSPTLRPRPTVTHHCTCAKYILQSEYVSKARKQDFPVLVAQWPKICLPRQGTQDQSLVREHFTRHGAAKPVRPNYRAHMLQLLKPAHLEPGLHNKRSHRSEKAEHHNEEKPPLATTRGSPHSNKDPEQPKVNWFFF